jgi:hypothetical protein
MRLPPPTAQEMLVDLEKFISENPENAAYVESRLKKFWSPENEFRFAMVTIVQPGHLVPAVLCAAESGMWLFDLPDCNPIIGCIWDSWVRFDVAPTKVFVTVGYTLYSGDIAIEERLKMGELLKAGELTGGHLYALQFEGFLKYITSKVNQFGVPTSAHELPKMV